MTIQNLTNDGLLPVFLSLHGTLATFKSIPRERLVEICAPSSVVPNGKPKQARQTLTRWTDLGAFVEQGGEMKLAPELAAIAFGDLDGLRREVLRILLRPENSPYLEAKDLLGSGVDDDAEDLGGDDDERRGSDETTMARASDFSRSAAWAMLQDPYSFAPTSSEVVELQNKQGLRPRAIRNKERWPGFEVWTAFTGVTSLTPSGLVLNPSLALRLALAEIFAQDGRLSLDELLSRIARRLPFLDGGRFQEAILESPDVPRPGAREISRSLSLALHQLQAEGCLVLLDVSDAERRILLGRGSTTFSYTHAERRVG